MDSFNFSKLLASFTFSFLSVFRDLALFLFWLGVRERDLVWEFDLDLVSEFDLNLVCEFDLERDLAFLLTFFLPPSSSAGSIMLRLVIDEAREGGLWEIQKSTFKLNKHVR